MQLSQSTEFYHLHSDHLALALAKNFPMIAQLGVESGARLKRHIEYNLLKPGRGGVAVQNHESSFNQPCTSQLSNNQLTYTPADPNAIRWSIRWPDDRSFIVHLHHDSQPICGEFFRIAFDPAICPPSIFAQTLTTPPFPRPPRASMFDLPDLTVDYNLPAFVHFPDFGGLIASCDDPRVSARQTFAASPDNIGLNLGCKNTAYHTSCVAYHHGHVTLSFHASQPLHEIELLFRVDDEHYPRLPAADFSDPKWNGLKRCWQNAFTLSPQTLSMGDNILLPGIAHLAIHFKSDMSLFTPPLIAQTTVHTFLRRALQITLHDCVGPTGEINSNYARPGYQKPGNDFGFFDSNISSFIALYNYIAATGDWSVATENINNIRRTARFLLAFDQDNDGILELPFDGNAFRQNRECRNWWDNFSFGHKDAYINLLAYRAFGNLAEILAPLGYADDVQALTDCRSRLAANFHSTFFNSATGVHAGWISADGNIHDYMFTFISAMAINENLVTPDLARQILHTLLDQLRAAGYGQWKWGIPGPLLPVTESDNHIWLPMQQWGSYENGGFCGQTAYHFIQALYHTGLRDIADSILFSLCDTFEHNFTHSGVFPGYLRSCDWRTREGIPCGYNYLADNYYFLLAALTGHFNIPMPKITPPREERSAQHNESAA